MLQEPVPNARFFSRPAVCQRSDGTYPTLMDTLAVIVPDIFEDLIIDNGGLEAKLKPLPSVVATRSSVSTAGMLSPLLMKPHAQCAVLLPFRVNPFSK